MWSFFKGELTTQGLLQTQLCKFLIGFFVIFQPFIFLSISIHDILSNLVFIMYIFLIFLVLILVDVFNTPNSLQAHFKGPCLTGTKEFNFKLFYLLT